MLLLSRHVGEEIVLADGIRVAVLQVSGQKVRLGITAPPSMPVLRLELTSRNGHSAALAPPTELTEPAVAVADGVNHNAPKESVERTE